MSKTFTPISIYKDFVEIILVLATELAERLSELRLMGRTMTLEAKSIKLDTRHRSNTFGMFIFRKKDVVDEAMKLFKDMWPIEDPCRCVHIRFNNLRGQSALKIDET